MATTQVFGEKSSTLIAAVFPDGGTAERAVTRLRKLRPSERPWVRLVEPGDPELGHKLEPETRGIWHTAARSHLKLGGIGLIAGLLIGAGLVVSGMPAFESSPVMTPVVAGLIGLFAGLLTAGLLTARPDHDVVISTVREATDAGQWAVVARPTDKQQAQAATSELEDTGGNVVRSL